MFFLPQHLSQILCLLFLFCLLTIDGCLYFVLLLGVAQAMWLMLQIKEPEDFVIATGDVHSVRELVELAFKIIGVEIVYVQPWLCI